VRIELDSTPAAQLARSCADRLVDLVERTDGQCIATGESAPSGFAAGPAGVGWALTKFAATGAGPRYASAGQLAARRAGLPTRAAIDGSYGWCAGMAGLVLANTCVTDGDIRSRPAAERTAEVSLLDDRPLLRNLSLCHGELGIAEALAVLARTDGGHGIVRARRRRAGLVLDAISRHTPCCGTPDGVETPGLLNGLAGIGYGLLRLGFPEQVPSVLLLEPTPAPAKAH
jgi:lantibiotic modifying enzyme